MLQLISVIKVLNYMLVWISDSDEKEEEEYEKEEVGEDGEIILVSGDKVSGPWNKSSGPPSAAPGKFPVLV